MSPDLRSQSEERGVTNKINDGSDEIDGCGEIEDDAPVVVGHLKDVPGEVNPDNTWHGSDCVGETPKDRSILERNIKVVSLKAGRDKSTCSNGSKLGGDERRWMKRV